MGFGRESFKQEMIKIVINWWFLASLGIMAETTFTVLLNEMYRCPYFTCNSTCSHLSGFYFDVLRNVSAANHFYGRFVIDGKLWTFLYVSIKLSSSRDYIWFILSLRLRRRGLIKSSSRQVKKNHVGGRRKKYNVIYVISKHLNHMHPNLIKLQIIIPVLIKLRSEDNPGPIFLHLFLL